MENVKEIQLSFYQNKHLESLSKFELPESQVRFTALPEEILNVSEGQYRIVILSEDLPVGFFLLHNTERVREYSNSPNAMLLTALSVDHKHQGKGYAKKAMVELKEFITMNFKYCDEIILAVNHKNIPAQNLYKNVGFIDTGRRKAGEIGEQFIMQLKIH
ncbi:GNAT family N-acetyltransferase [Paenibacillus sp. PK3_47]|uniref:GNAT family N-acetyltransferase n=1 Tax=Paenibacillus sp. PK3_47 TaxID=2072642 RepID=UPI00201E0383|nr:GNAT family N-acetyltransferase [Paenibacillus sp. PK3_47]UQZ36643.1 GNAT family N-acetyltransferase [Paenibacillus sp. PK3_47]